MKQWRKLTVGINYLLRGAAQLRRARLRLLPRGREKVSLDKYRTGVSDRPHGGLSAVGSRVD